MSGGEAIRSIDWLEINGGKDDMKGKIIYLTYARAVEFLLPKHYSGRKPVISKAFGWVIDGELMAVCSFGKPASPSLCVGLAGEEYSSHVYELNRLCRKDELSEPISQFVGACLRRLKPENWIIVSYADSGMNHNGYVYQACNFIYTGATKRRTDKYTEGNKHSRHYSNDEQNGMRKVRTSKHRYVYFCTASKKLRREWRESLRYKEEPYPKGENKTYILGDYMEPEIIKTNDLK